MDLINRLTIDTPEQVTLEYQLAGMGSRFLGVLFDSLIQIIIYFALALIAAFAMPARVEWWTPASKWVQAGIILFSFCLYWGYYAIFEIIWKGQTPGKRQAGIRVIKEDGRSITAFDAVARNLLRIVDQFPGFYAVGLITMYFNKSHKRLGDFVAGTVVVHDRKPDEGQVIWSMPADSKISGETSSLTDADLQVLETFLERRLDLPLDIRRSTAERLAALYVAKLNIERDPKTTNEDILEMIAIQLRNEKRFRTIT